MRDDAPVEPAVGEHPLDLVGEHEQRRHRRGVVGLVLAGVVERRRDRQELGDPPVGRRQLLDARDRGRAQQREPQPAVGGEALLRREVVGVGLRRRRRGGRRRRRSRRRGRARRRRRGAHDLDHHAGRRLVVRPGEDVGGRIRDRCGRAAGIGLHDDRVAEERRSGADRRELLGELAEAQVQGALADETGGGGVPEGGRAAVAEDDLVVLGEREELTQTGPDATDDGLDRGLSVRGAHDVGLVGEMGELFGTDLGRAAAEAAIGGKEVLGDVEGEAAGGHGPRLQVPPEDQGDRAQVRRRGRAVAAEVGADVRVEHEDEDPRDAARRRTARSPRSPSVTPACGRRG